MGGGGCSGRLKKRGLRNGHNQKGGGVLCAGPTLIKRYVGLIAPPFKIIVLPTQN